MKNRKVRGAGLRLVSLLLSLLLLWSLSSVAVADGVADRSQMAAVENVVEDGMTPLYGDSLVDGDYPVSVDSSSSMFRIADCRLRVEGAAMTAVLTMSGTAYRYLWPGTAEEADALGEESWIKAETDSEGRCFFRFPVEALDAGVLCAAWSKNKELWYDRTLCFRSDSLPVEAFREGVLTTAKSLDLRDGTYTVKVGLSGGSGRAGIESPTRLTVQDGACTAIIRWGSRNYDYMKVGGERFEPLPNEETSAFEIPVTVFDRPTAVIADTVAMSEPHEIEYRLEFDSSSIREEKPEETPSRTENAQTSAEQTGLTRTEPYGTDAPGTEPSQNGSSYPAEAGAGHLKPMYAENFSVDFQEDGTALLTLGGKEQFLLLPSEAEAQSGESESGTASGSYPKGTWNQTGLPVIRVPVKSVYSASSSVPDLFLHCGAAKALRFTSTDKNSWRLPEIRDLFSDASLVYAGKYSAPDYELLLEEGCDLVIENTMILHNPETREKLEALGIPVMIEYSSYEPHPLGRVEWIRLYGLLTGHSEEAEAFFRSQTETLSALQNTEKSGKRVAFFHITSTGAAVVRKSADYVSRMIELAGGESVFRNLPGDDNALSTVTMQLEAFYAQALDADVLVYNSTASAELHSLQELLDLCPLLQDFRAVKNGDVWCTEKSMFQQSSATAGMIADFHTVLSGEAENGDLRYLYRLT